MSWFKKLFIPHEENDFKPHALQKAAMFGMMALVLISFSVANLQSIIWISSEWLVSTILPAVVTEETNKARASAALPPLVRNETLDQAAQMKADHMAAESYFAHSSPSGISPWHWFTQAGYNYVYAGENLAVHFTDSSAVVEAWLDSPSHRANIMDGNYREIGIGTATGRYEGYDTVFVVQMFGSPAVPPVAEAPAVTTPAPVVEVTEIASEASNVQEGSVAGETNVAVTEAGTVVYESYAATEVPGAVLAEVSEPSYQLDRSSSFWGRLATSPRLVLQIMYSFIGLFVVASLLVALVIEWRRHHPIQSAYSAGLLAAMILLFVLHTAVSGGATIV